ncbi:hypothetical protein AB0945_34780 [Streptomyces sp. NPDC005474]|uniref:hypothetical protein n=1 Tax=Streptomyces sp. NPDC005474 TaxID=3154878 RepID=UPI00345291D1
MARSECAYGAAEMIITVTGDRKAMTEPIKALAQYIAEEAWEGSLALTQKLLTPAEEVVREAGRYVPVVTSGLAGCGARRAGCLASGTGAGGSV